MTAVQAMAPDKGRVEAFGVDVSNAQGRLATRRNLGYPVVAGQSRGVVALWLALRGVEAERRTSLLTAYDPDAPDAYDRGLPRNADHDCSTPSVIWSAQDLAATRAIVSLPDSQVSEVLNEGWSRWINAGTGTDDLLEALDLAPLGRYDNVVPRPATSC